MSENQTLPGYWELLWMLFMQPVSLHHRLKACGIEEPGAPGWWLWRNGGVQRAYALRMLVLLLTATSVLAGGLSLALKALGFDVVWLWLALSLALSLVLGVALSVAFGMATGVVLGVGAGMASILAVGIVLGVDAGIASILVVGVVFVVTAFICFVRAPSYLLESLTESLLYLLQRLTGWQSLRYSPPLHHDLIYFPLPFLVSHIVLTEETNPILAQRVIDTCLIAPGLRLLGGVAFIRLLVRALELCARNNLFSALIELPNNWLLSGLAALNTLLAGFADVARYIQAAQHASLAYHRLNHLCNGLKAFQALENQFLVDRSILARELRPILPAWRSAQAIRWNLKQVGRCSEAASIW
jgi:hypothetical protein